MKSRDVDYILTWEGAFHAGVDAAGGKGWNLSRLARYGFRIPAGFVLSAEAHRDFLDFNRLGELQESTSCRIDAEGLDAVDKAAAHLRERIMGGVLPPGVVAAVRDALSLHAPAGKSLAVRSSASAEDSRQASFAGIHDSFLNVIGFDAAIEAVKGCYASLWTPRAVAYRRKLNKADREMMMAVVIMEMVKAESAGTAFSCDPRSGRRDLIVINANFGLGESVVAGSVEPDTFCLGLPVYTAVPEIKNVETGSKQAQTRTLAEGGVYLRPCSTQSPVQVLNDKDIAGLGNLITRVFDALGDGEEPQDVEWAFDGKMFYLLQARPVTALPKYSFKETEHQPVVWSNGNYRDALPMVLSPLHRRVMKHIIDTIHFTAFAEPGYPIPEGFQFSRFFDGRLYCNMTDLYWAYYDCHGVLPARFTPLWGGHQESPAVDDPDPFRGPAGLRRQQFSERTMASVAEAAAGAANTFSDVATALENLAGEGFKHLPDSQFVSRFEALGRIAGSYSERYCFISSAGIAPFFMLMQRLSARLGERAASTANGLMAGGEASITSADQGYRLAELAQLARQDEDASECLNSSAFDPSSWEKQLPENSPFKRAFRQFLKEYGHRAVYELDIINPRWQEDPTYLFDIVRSTMQTADPAGWRVVQKAKFDRAWNEISPLFPNDQLEAVRRAILDAQQGAGLREMNKSVLVSILNVYRSMALELGNRFSARGLLCRPDDIFFCTWPEIFSVLGGEWDGAGLKLLVEDRITSHREKEELVPPDVVKGEKPVFSEAEVDSSGHYLEGIGAAAGKAGGKACIIHHPGQGNRLLPGEVLVAPSTDPGWTPLFLKACAVVMETGGFTSHGAIVAREYGLPAVINVPGVLRALKDGQAITVDGDEGRVYLRPDSI